MARDIKKVLFDYEVLRRTQAGIAHFSSRDAEKVRKACGEDPDGSGALIAALKAGYTLGLMQKAKQRTEK